MTTNTQVGITPESLRAKYGDSPQPIEKAGYLMFFLGQNIVFGVMMAAMTAFWQFTLAIPLETIAIIQLVAKAWDAINDPMLGVIVQKSPQTKHGKYKPWAFATAFGLPFMVMLCFINVNPGIDGVDGARASLPVIFYALITYILYGMTYTLCDAPAFAMATTMEPDAKKRAGIIMYGRIGSGIAGLFTSSIFWMIQGAIPGHQSFFFAVAAMMAITMFTMVMVFLCKERNIIPSKEPVNAKSVAKFVGTNKHVGKFIIIKTVISLTTAFVFAAVVTVVLSGIFGAVDGGSGFGTNASANAQITLAFTTGSIIGFALPFMIGPTIKKVGKRKTCIINGAIGLVIATIGGIAVLSTKNYWWYLLFQAGSMWIMQVCIMLPFTMTPDSNEYSAYKTGIRQVVVGQSVSSFTTKMDMAIASFMSSMIFAMVGVQSGSDAMFNDAAIASANTVLWICVVAIILAGVLVIALWGFWWNLDRADIQAAAIHNMNGTTDEFLDLRLGIDRKADFALMSAKARLVKAKQNYSEENQASVKELEDAKNNLKVTKVQVKDDYKKLKVEIKARKDEIAAARKSDLNMKAS